MSEIDHLSNDILSEDSKHRKALSLLLEKYSSQKDKIIVQKTMMGGSEAFLGAVTLEWFSQKVRFAHALPLFQKYLNEKTHQLEVDEETIEEVQQRPLDWSRQAALAQYLAGKKNHKFPPILAVTSRGWVDDPKSDDWGNDGRALNSAAAFSPLDSSGRIGLLDVSEDVQIYALDGQHRLMGTIGLMTLIREGELQRRRKDGRAQNSVLKISEIVDLYGVTQEEIQDLGKEKIGIEFIAAVVSGETREHAKRRVRSIFVHVNTMAAPLSKSQTDQLDEDNGFAVVARNVAVRHPLLKGRVDWNKTNVTEKARELTTLHTLKDMARGFLIQHFKNWDKTEKNLIPLRPPENELKEGAERYYELFNYIQKLPKLISLSQGGDAESLRPFSPDGAGLVLLRPVGQAALADALGQLVFGTKKMELEKLFAKLAKYDADGGLSNFSDPKSHWYGILYDPVANKIRVSGRALATKLFVYLLGGGLPNDDEREKLRAEIAAARTIENKAIIAVDTAVDPAEVKLPNVL